MGDDDDDDDDSDENMKDVLSPLRARRKLSVVDIAGKDAAKANEKDRAPEGKEVEGVGKGLESKTAKIKSEKAKQQKTSSLRNWLSTQPETKRLKRRETTRQSNLVEALGSNHIQCKFLNTGGKPKRNSTATTVIDKVAYTQSGKRVLLDMADESKATLANDEEVTGTFKDDIVVDSKQPFTLSQNTSLRNEIRIHSKIASA
eukprot:scaffold33652_cov221-Skeletonema_dohrnii-CCMP3373.AAC.1